MEPQLPLCWTENRADAKEISGSVNKPGGDLKNARDCGLRLSLVLRACVYMSDIPLDGPQRAGKMSITWLCPASCLVPGTMPV